jgi:hypothetical protein
MDVEDQRLCHKFLTGNLRRHATAAIQAVWNDKGPTRIFDDSFAPVVWLDDNMTITREPVDGHRGHRRNHSLKAGSHFPVRVENDKAITKKLPEDEFATLPWKRNHSGEK